MGHLFRDGTTSVDRDLIRSADKSYAIRQIHSVRLASYRRLNGLWQASAIIAGLVTVTSLNMWGDGSSDWKEPLAFAAVCALAAFALYRFSRAQVHIVYIAQARNHETAVYETLSLQQANAMRSAVEGAMSNAGSGG